MSMFLLKHTVNIYILITTRVCSSFVTFFTKFEFASSSQIVLIFVYFTAKIGTICEEDADSNFVKKVTKLEKNV